MTSVAVMTPVIICDSSSEDEEDVVPYEWQESRPVQYKLLDVFGDNNLPIDDKKTKSTVIEDDDNDVLVVEEEKTVSVNEHAIDLTEDSVVMPTGNYTRNSDVIHNSLKQNAASTLCEYTKHVSQAVQGSCVVSEEDLIVTGESKTIHDLLQKEVVVYGPVTDGPLDGCQNEESSPRCEEVPARDVDSGRVSEADSGRFSYTEEELPSESSMPRPVSDPIMNLAFRDNMRLFMTPEDREIVPRWSAIQNGDMVDPLCTSDAVDDAPVQYTTIEDVPPPPEHKTSKSSSGKKLSQSKRKRCSGKEEEFIPGQKTVKHKNKSKPTAKRGLNAVSHKAVLLVHKTAKTDSRTRRRPGRPRKGPEALRLPPCCVRVCYGMIHHGTRIECPRVVTPPSRHNKGQHQNRRQPRDKRQPCDRPPQDRLRQMSKHTKTKQTKGSPQNNKHKADSLPVTVEDLEYRKGSSRGVLGRRRFSREAKSKPAVI